MEKITNWNAARSGASITVTGVDEAADDVKLTGVTLIEVMDGAVVATDDEGKRYELVVNASVTEPA